MTQCCKCSINLKSSVYNQTGESYVTQVSQHRRMCLHLRRILQARSVVETRNPRYLRLMQKRCRPALCKLKLAEGCPSDDTIDRIAYDSQHHPAEVIRLSRARKSTSKDRGCSRCMQAGVTDPGCPCHDMKDYPNTGKSAADYTSPQRRSREAQRDKRQERCPKDDYSPSVRSRRSSPSARPDEAGGRRCSPQGSPETFREHAAERKEEEALYAKFVYDITQDIVQHGLYTDRELKEVFERHIDKNSDRLSKRKMLYEIYQLKISLNMTEDEGEDEEEDEAEADLVYAARFSALRVPKPPTPPKVLNENKVIERLATLGCDEANRSGASSPGCRGVVLVEPNPEFLVTERDVLATLVDECVSPEQIQRIYRSLCQRSRDVSLCEPVHVGKGVAYAHRLRRVDRCNSAPSLDKACYMAEHLKSILRKEATDFVGKRSFSPPIECHPRYTDAFFQQPVVVEKCNNWRFGLCDCGKPACKKHAELPERDNKTSPPRSRSQMDRRPSPQRWSDEDRRCCARRSSEVEKRGPIIRNEPDTKRSREVGKRGSVMRNEPERHESPKRSREVEQRSPVVITMDPEKYEALKRAREAEKRGHGICSDSERYESPRRSRRESEKRGPVIANETERHESPRRSRRESEKRGLVIANESERHESPRRSRREEKHDSPKLSREEERRGPVKLTNEPEKYDSPRRSKEGERRGPVQRTSDMEKSGSPKCSIDDDKRSPITRSPKRRDSEKRRSPKRSPTALKKPRKVEAMRGPIIRKSSTFAADSSRRKSVINRSPSQTLDTLPRPTDDSGNVLVESSRRSKRSDDYQKEKKNSEDSSKEKDSLSSSSNEDNSNDKDNERPQKNDEPEEIEETIEEEIETDLEDGSPQPKSPGKTSPDSYSDISDDDEDDEDDVEAVLATVREELKEEVSDADDSPKGGRESKKSDGSAGSRGSRRGSAKAPGDYKVSVNRRRGTSMGQINEKGEDPDPDSSESPSSSPAPSAYTNIMTLHDDDEDDEDEFEPTRQVRKRTSSGYSGVKIVDSWGKRVSEIAPSDFYRAGEAKYCEPGCREPGYPRSCAENCRFIRTNCRNLSDPTECLVKTRHKSESSTTTDSS